MNAYTVLKVLNLVESYHNLKNHDILRITKIGHICAGSGLNSTSYSFKAKKRVKGQKNMLILFERFHPCGVNTFYGMSKFYSVQKLLALQCVGPLIFP